MSAAIRPLPILASLPLNLSCKTPASLPSVDGEARSPEYLHHVVYTEHDREFLFGHVRTCARIPSVHQLDCPETYIFENMKFLGFCSRAASSPSARTRASSSSTSPAALAANAASPKYFTPQTPDVRARSRRNEARSPTADGAGAGSRSGWSSPAADASDGARTRARSNAHSRLELHADT